MPKYENGEVIHTERTRPLKLDNIVASTTFAKVNGSCVLDPDGSEESAMSTRLTITTDGNVIRAMQKGLGGSWKVDEIDNLMDVSLGKYGELKRLITE
jgi:exosome complex RNA-binding protein Rrp42 (RNase PH superfamily)